MANERLRAAMERHSVAVNELATLTEKDPKTVSRWLGGRVPHPRQRFLVARKLKEDEEFLWPGVKRNGAGADSAGEIVNAYPYRSDLPTSTWWDLVTRSTQQIDLLGYTLYFLSLEHPELIRVLREKCESGCLIRVAIADPGSAHVRYRDAEEEQPITLVARINTTLKAFAPLAECVNFDMHYQDVPLYNSIFRFDDQMLVTPHLFATPGASAPLLHLRRLKPGGLFSRFTEHFEKVWTTTKPIN